VETILWTILGLFLLYLWLKGHWFGWVLAWPAIAWVWLLVTEVPAPGGGPRWNVLLFSGAIAGLPMAVRAAIQLLRA
jgi:hypothetical protein